MCIRMAAVVCVMGLPGSGKTTTCEYIKSSFPQYDIHHIEFDKYLSDKFDPVEWKNARKIALDTVQELRKSTQLILLDDVFQYKSMRKEFRPNGIIYIETRLDECLLVNSKRSIPVPRGIIEKMAQILQPPQSATILHQRSVPSQTDYLPFLTRVFQNAAQAANAQATCTAHSITQKEQTMNNFETQLRKIISQRKQPYTEKTKHIKQNAMTHFRQTLNANEALTQFQHQLNN